MSVVAPHFSSFHVCSVDFYHFRDSEGSSTFDLTTSCGCCAVQLALFKRYGIPN